MKVIILHSAQVADSRALMSELGVDPQMNEEIVQAPSGWAVSGKHSYATMICPGFSAYPAVVVIADDGRMRVKSPVESVAECLEFINGVSDSPLPDLTKLGFLALFTDEEKVRLKGLESTDPTVALFWEEYRTADSIRLDDPRVIRGLSYLAALGHITEARKTEILGGA